MKTYWSREAGAAEESTGLSAFMKECKQEIMNCEVRGGRTGSDDVCKVS